MQENQPIAYFSKKISVRMQSASTYQKELYAIFEAVQKWRQYLLGRFFIIRADHRSIKELLQQVVQTPKQQIYVQKLLRYNFQIEYKPRRSNKVANALSRVHEESIVTEKGNLSLAIASYTIPEFLEFLQKKNSTLAELVGLHRELKAGNLTSEFSAREGLLLHKGRYYLGEESSLKEGMLHEFHSTPIAGHPGVKRTLTRLSSIFFWP